MTTLDFADAVMLAAATVPPGNPGRFGRRKVFIDVVHKHIQRAKLWRGTLTAFKAKLVAAHRAGRLELARADLVGAMPWKHVRASLTTWDGVEYHFVMAPYMFG